MGVAYEFNTIIVLEDPEWVLLKRDLGETNGDPVTWEQIKRGLRIYPIGVPIQLCTRTGNPEDPYKPVAIGKVASFKPVGEFKWPWGPYMPTEPSPTQTEIWIRDIKALPAQP